MGSGQQPRPNAMRGADRKDLNAVQCQLRDEICYQIVRRRKPSQPDLGSDLPCRDRANQWAVSVPFDGRARGFGEMGIVCHPPDQRVSIQE